MPDKTNFFAKFTFITKTGLKEAFEMNTWKAERAGGGHYDLKNDWSDLFLEGEENTPIMTGYINFEQHNLRILHNILDRLPMGYSYELYDDDENVILEKDRVYEPVEETEGEEEGGVQA